jgi:predicted AAA+ superfamily ATPase
MLKTLQSMLLDFHEADLETGVQRRLQVRALPRKATVCIGVRRCGKSTFLHQVIQGLLDQGVPKANVLFLNFFDDRLHGLRGEDLGLVAEAYYGLFPEKKNTERVYFFLDEIQAVAGWEAFVERVLRTEKCEVYLTGSSAHLLSREMATQMRGRALSWEVFPFSFREFLDWKELAALEPMSARKRLLVEKAFQQFWEQGGFPEVAGLDRGVRTRIHQEYLQAILFRDVVERHDVSHPRAVSDLAHRLLDNVAAMYSVNALTGYLQSLGHKMPKATVADCLDWFEDAYFLFTVRLFDASLARRNANPKKIYCVDHALVTSTASGILVNSGHLLENLVFTALRRLHPEVFYYRTRNGREVDFVVPTRSGRPRLVQVCEALAEPQTRKRELSALREAMAELGVNRATLVTRAEAEEVKLEGGTIDVVPAWRFLLDQPDAATD